VASTDDSQDKKWQELHLLKQKLAVSISEEDFAGAVSLRDSIETLTETLSTTEQYCLRLIQSLQESTSVKERTEILSKLAELGNMHIVPDVAALLRYPELCTEAENCMIRLFHKHEDIKINRLMQEGSQALVSMQFQHALDLFEEITSIDPYFAEGHNKKATTLYLMRRFEESIKVCLLVIDLQPYHFGALTGMGLCHYRLGQDEQAIQAFDQALFVNPGLTKIREMAESLRKGNLPNL